MDFWNLLAALLTLTALFAYLNDRWLKQPTATGTMLVALLFSLALIVLHRWGLDLSEPVGALLKHIHFETTVLHGMLGYLLFAGALQIDVSRLKENAWVVIVLASLGTLLSTLFIGIVAYYTLQWVGLPLPFIASLLIGALISPTDPVAVLAILKTAGAPPSLDIQIAGESLFNDGVALTLFLLFFAMTFNTVSASWDTAFTAFAVEVAGGITLGAALGWSCFYLLQRVTGPTVIILLTLAVASGGFALARHLGVSAPLAMVVAGLIVGHRGRHHALTPAGRDQLYLFWSVIDEILNAVLFVLIGMEVVVMPFHRAYVQALLALIPGVLAARALSTGVPWLLMRRHCHFDDGALTILVWGGLRGALSIALALSLPPGKVRDTAVAVTYGVVVFSMLVQGTTIRRLVARCTARPEAR
jgi:CPA1 family monovalent cation:H+ antiporter